MLTRSLIESRSRSLLNALVRSNGNEIKQKIVLTDVNDHLAKYPNSAELFAPVAGNLLSVLRSTSDKIVESKARQTLALLGHADAPKSRGLNILSIDGGGTKGLVCIELLRRLEQLNGKRVHEMFDLICGVSSGAIIAMAVGSGRITLDECEQLYRELSQTLFATEMWRAAPRLFLNHAYYDTSVWESMLKKLFGPYSLMSLSCNPTIPKLIAVAAIMNRPAVQPYLFRTYQPRSTSTESRFIGCCDAQVWQAVRASSAAPGFFEEYKFSDYILQDGGVLVNNSTGIAISEASSLWPNEPIQCVVSIGSGKFIPMKVPIVTTGTSAVEKLSRLVDSATDTEMIHTILHHLLPNGYYRLNPTLSEYFGLSENRSEKLDRMKVDTVMYIRRNELKFNSIAQSMSQGRPWHWQLWDWLRERRLILQSYRSCQILQHTEQNRAKSVTLPRRDTTF